MRTADDVFRSELENRRIEYTVTGEGLYEVQINDQSLNVSLENVRRNFERDGDADAIVRFVEGLATAPNAETPTWEEIRPYVRYSLEPSDYEMGFGDVLYREVNNDLNQVFVYTSADGSRITWINESSLREWSVTRDEVLQQAEENMAEILAEAELEITDVDGNSLGMISTEESPFKASLILSPAFRNLVSATHSWPVYVVVPCRDFVYVIPDDSYEFLGRLGRVVVNEYGKSGYPITLDVLQVSDDGITAIGTYADAQ